MPHARLRALLSRCPRPVLLALLLAGAGTTAGADESELLSREEREALDLSEYRVNEPDAGYFDVAARMSELDRVDSSILLQEIDQLAQGPSCQQLLEYEPITTRVRIPGYYPNPEEWELASEPLFRFEDNVSMLAGAFVASGDDYYAECLVRYLDHWAEAEALTDFHYDSMQPQAWFATESMLFAAGMAYSVVRPYVEGLEEERERLEAWLNELAHLHADIPGEPDNSCCNNHFYRRALYGSVIGVLTEDDELFRFGVSAIYSALHDMTDQGALPLEVNRGRRATHYQNYALLYLVTNMQVVARQGYEEIFDLEIEGRTIHDGVDFLFEILEDPAALGDYAPLEQYTGFLKDPQYFTWMEIYQTRFDDSRVDDFVTRVRPLYNRSAGGYATLYFMSPDAQTHVHQDEEQRQTEAFRGLGQQ
ncbi:alginate lyase family protein [Halomonas heilongjiangensis]|uniref:Poly(Beta-D-mannuronate) lyase n=1 Tax=Halomonas heilongjiangensis TaxID=1387883 RepID=A0A2N7TNI5_9GAMM|nr:alginate lyase family protein [Halomonas heilongjiangensis]PMR69757.1 poly(beta-D-mannuronate) lyase [Halomonas heilongjiangensis]PXX90579.1 poly(beta-D-mannuronate) lyase [Halomonas heilongjiangensis]